LNVKFKFSESGSDIQNNENECFGVSESNGRELEIKSFYKELEKASIWKL
jgi:hypothetical protein